MEIGLPLAKPLSVGRFFVVYRLKWPPQIFWGGENRLSSKECDRTPRFRSWRLLQVFWLRAFPQLNSALEALQCICKLRARLTTRACCLKLRHQEHSK